MWGGQFLKKSLQDKEKFAFVYLKKMVAGVLFSISLMFNFFLTTCIILSVLVVLTITISTMTTRIKLSISSKKRKSLQMLGTRKRAIY